MCEGTALPSYKQKGDTVLYFHTFCRPDVSRRVPRGENTNPCCINSWFYAEMSRSEISLKNLVLFSCVNTEPNWKYFKTFSLVRDAASYYFLIHVCLQVLSFIGRLSFGATRLFRTNLLLVTLCDSVSLTSL